MSEPTTGHGPQDAHAPVSFIPSDTPDRGPEDGIVLCLSGGGYRAMLFHLGAVWRINELGLLPRLARISSVSAGSIVAGLLGLKWHALRFDAAGVAAAFDAEIVAPIRALASRTGELDQPVDSSGRARPRPSWELAQEATDSFVP
jgi:predicted acylesterase/phospholipase RssA